MEIFKAKIKRLKHILKHSFNGDFNKHEAIDYVYKSDIKVFKRVFTVDKTSQLRCKCGAIFYENKSKI